MGRDKLPIFNFRTRLTPPTGPLWIGYTVMLIFVVAVLQSTTERLWVYADSLIIDGLFQLRNAHATADRDEAIIIVREDEESRSRLKTSDLREFHPALLKILAHPLIRVVAFDHKYVYE